jgi:hypothetical protein
MQTVQQKNQSKTMQQQCKISFTLRLWMLESHKKQIWLIAL